MVLAASLFAVGLATTPAEAASTSRYAGVGGSTADPSCTDSAHPCDLEHAIVSVANAGDDVTVEPGTYTLLFDLHVPRSLIIHGQDGQPRPRLLVGSVNDSVDAASVLRYLDIELSGGFFFGLGTAEQLIVSGGSGCLLGAPLAFRDSVCASTTGDAVIVETNGGTETVDLRNVTAIAPGLNNNAIRVGTQATGGHVTVNAYNTIAIGGGGSGVGLRAQTLGTGTATINTNHSDYIGAVPSGLGAAINTSITDQHAAPVFQPGTYREAAGSTATIGKGLSDPLNGAFDIDGDLRTINGVTDIGADQFVLPPSIAGVSGAGVDGHATVDATINPNGSPTSYSVVYGTTPAYGGSSSTLTLAATATAQPVAVPLGGLTPGTTYHYAVVATNNAGSTMSADQSFATVRVSGTIGTSGVPAVLPAVGAVTLSPNAFPAAPRGPSVLAAKRRYGTKVSYTLNEAADVRFTVAQFQSGRAAKGGRCVRPTRANSRARRCTRRVTLPGSFTRAGTAGANSFRFTGRLRGRKLRRGRYQLVASPSAGGKAGRAARASFRIIG